MAAIFRRSTYLATRFIIQTSRFHTTTSSILANHNNNNNQIFKTNLFYSTTVANVKQGGHDDKLVSIIESEIQCAHDEPATQDEGAYVPAGFPFKIDDQPGEQVVKLTRQYEDETIEVEVYMPDLVTGDEHDDDNADENSPQSHLPLLVKISKDGGPSLEFSCSANADEVNIESLSVKDPGTSDDMAYDGPDFGDLDENLQKAFHKYLNVRGITPLATNFLHEYMINKDGREYKMWLKNLKKFIEA